MSELSMKDQLRIVRDRCPDVWEKIIIVYSCPSNIWLHDNMVNHECEFGSIKCRDCWNSAIGNDT